MEALRAFRPGNCSVWEPTSGFELELPVFGGRKRFEAVIASSWGQEEGLELEVPVFGGRNRVWSWNCQCLGAGRGFGGVIASVWG